MECGGQGREPGPVPWVSFGLQSVIQLFPLCALVLSRNNSTDSAGCSGLLVWSVKSFEILSDRCLENVCDE